MKALFSLFAIILACSACLSQKLPIQPGEKIYTDASNKPLDSSQVYFPPESRFYKSEDSVAPSLKTRIIKRDSFYHHWFSKQLYALQEPLLFNKNFEKEVYRFTWLRTFHHPVAIRIEKNRESFQLTWKVCNGAGGYEPGTLFIDQTKTITAAQWATFTLLLKECNFWDSPAQHYKRGLDGAQWIMEGNDGSYYKVLSYWSPEEGAYFEACNYLLSLTELKFKKRERY